MHSKWRGRVDVGHDVAVNVFAKLASGASRSRIAHHGHHVTAGNWTLYAAKVMAENYHENSLHEDQAGNNQDLSVNAFCFQCQILDLLVSYSSIAVCKTQSGAIREKSAAASFNPGRGAKLDSHRLTDSETTEHYHTLSSETK